MKGSLKPETAISHYRILTKLGAGGMGEVYLAEDTKLNRKVALKILPAEVAANEDRMRRFVQEAKSASALNHPNIITIYEIDQVDSAHFIASEFIDGQTLRERMRNEPLKLGQALDVAIQISSALSAAHAAGIIHRDIKPDNIMLRRDGIVKVLDFGLAKLTERPRSQMVDSEAPTRAVVKTEPGLVLGTAVYMSPEQARGLSVDERTDIFSLGVVLYELVAARLPFEGSTSSEVVASILSDKEPQPLARYSREVPTELERIVSKALRKDRDERYQTIKDLLIDLRTLKHKLEVDAEIDRTVPLEFRGAASTSAGLSKLATVSAAAAAPTGTAVANSSAEYIVSEIKRHKLAVAIILLVVCSGVALFAYHVAPRNTEAAIDSIAVIPFVNQNQDPEAEWISDGLTDSIINSLTQLPNLKVIGRNSVFRYKGKETDALAVGNDLGVRAVLTGRLMQRGETMLISTELVDVSNNKQLWGEQYERKVADILSVQREIAREITNNLRPTLSGVERARADKQYTANPEAYQLYQRGRYYWSKRTVADFQKAITFFEQATEKDPNYALAYSGLADSYALLSGYGDESPRQLMPKARAHRGRLSWTISWLKRMPH
jgi:serine/threonine-protein kinase